MPQGSRRVVLSLFLLTAAPFLRAGCLDLDPAVGYAASTNPRGVVVADFNRDGRPDLAVANAGASSVSVLLANGDGTFAAATHIGVGSSPSSLVAADLNRDGREDLAVANFGSGSVTILMGDGFGGFISSSPATTGSGPLAIAAADLDHDGALDLAVANASAGSVSILIGDSFGGFTPGTAVTVGSNPQSIATGDFDGDGHEDLAVANHDSNNVSFLSGNGDGSFDPAASFAVAATPPALASAPAAVRAADLDGDGDLDLAVAAETSKTAAILLGNGAGSFGAATSFAVGLDPRALVVADFSGDGKADLAVANHGANTISLLSGNGSGGFATAVNFSTTTGPAALAAGDFDRDGQPDLVSANFGSDEVSVLLNGSGCFANCGTFGAATSFGQSFGGGRSVAAGDLDGDGVVDLAVARGNSNQVSVLLGTGAGAFGSAGDFSAGSVPVAVGIADFDRDGFPDLAVVNEFSDNVSILTGDGSGSFTLATTPSTCSGPGDLVMGDFDQDGATDLAVTCSSQADLTILRNTTAAGSSSTTFSTTTITSVGSEPHGLATGDLDRDGDLDLAVADYGGVAGPDEVLILSGNGSGGFVSTGSVGVGFDPEMVALGDFDRDGDLDMAVPNAGSNSVTIWLGNGSGSFFSGSTLSAGSSAVAIAVADFDRDGLLDLALLNGSGSSVSILLGNGSGGFSAASPSSFAAGNSVAALVATDLDGDGKPDLAVANSTSSGSVDVLLNGCPPPDLAIEKSHFGTLIQGGTAQYTIAVTNVGTLPSGGRVKVVDTLPAGLSATSMGGLGWDCTLASLTCTRSDSLAASSAFPSIVLDVNVDTSAPVSVNNVVTLSGGGDATPANNSDSDAAAVTQYANMTIAKTHAGSFFQGQQGAAYSITVSNDGGVASSGTVTVTDSLPFGLTATAIGGTGWTCTLGSLTCTRSNALASGASYPVITLTVNVAGNASSSVTNSATVSGGGEIVTSDNSASDLTNVTAVADLVVAKTHSGSFAQGRMFRSYTLTVSNVGSVSTSGTVTVSDDLPDGLTLSSIGGTGWNCTPATVRCSRTNPLAASASYPPVTVTVNVAGNAPPSVVNSASVSGGGEMRTDNNTSLDATTVGAGLQTCGRFEPPAQLSSTILSMRSVAFNDLNGDGNGDILATGGQDVVVMLGNGAGAFTPLTPFAAGLNPSSPILGDFNGDGKHDLAVVNQGIATISVLIGAGNGTFSAAVAYGAGNSPYTLAAGDLNGDGVLDLATANSQADSASVLIGNGDGTFDPAVNYTTDPSPKAVGIGDFDGDGDADLAVGTGWNTVSVFLNTGDGTFGARTNFSIGEDARSLVVEDFNHDGDPDLAVAQLNGLDVTVLLGNGDGTFGGRVDYPTGAGTFWLIAADLDHDGDADLAVANAAGIGVLKGNGNGTFGTSENYAAGTGTIGVAAGDVDGDGRADLVTANEISNNISILRSACPDLSVSKTHGANFTQGQVGAEYLIAISNIGPVNSVGTMTVTDQLPAGLVATGMSGTGWTCTLATLTCTRSNPIFAGTAAGITVTVNVNSNAPSVVVNTATLTGGGDDNPSNNTGSDSTIVNASGLIAPTRLVATATSTSQVNVSWDAVTTAVSYQLFRRDHNGAFALVASPAGTSFVDTGRSATTTYLYQVRAVNNAAAVSAPSNVDLATTIVLADDPLVPSIKALHFTQLRTAVDAVRTAGGLAAATYTNAIVPGGVIHAVDLAELRSRLDAARAAVSVSALTYTDPSPAGKIVKAAHVQELRLGVR